MKMNFVYNTQRQRKKCWRCNKRGGKKRIIKTVLREKQPEVFWLSSVRRRAEHGANPVTCGERGGRAERWVVVEKAGSGAELADLSHIASGAYGP